MQLSLRALLCTLAACTASTSISETPMPLPPTPASPPQAGRSPPRTTDTKCPQEPPAAGSTCSGQNFECTYGPEVHTSCESITTCSNGRWERRTCSSTCPETFAAIVPGTACADATLACSYDEGTCGCMMTDDAGADDAGLRPGTWKCVPPPTTTFCPRARPQRQDTCVNPVLCDYGSCALERRLAYQCNGAFWQATTLPTCEEP